MKKREGTHERFERLNEVFASLLRGRHAERAEQQRGSEAWLEERIHKLPERAKEEIRAYERQLADAGVANPGKRAELVDGKIIAFEQTYQDLRFTVGEGEYLLNKGYAKEQAVSHLKEMLGDSPVLDDLAKVALLNFDANGLKAVNDLSASHEKGDEYLRRIAEVFFSKTSPEALRLKELGIDEVLPVTAGGDEYSMLLKSKKAIPPEALEEALRLYEAAITCVDVADLVDFEDERVLLRYAGVTDKQFEMMDDAQRRDALAQVRKEVPPGFKMRASAPGGGATLYEGMLSALEHNTKPLTPEDGFNRAVDKIVGGMWDAADKPAMEHKNEFKARLRTAEASPEDKFYAKVLARSSEARILEARLEEITDENASLKLKLAKMEAYKRDTSKLTAMYKGKEIDATAYVKAQMAIIEAWEQEAV